MEELLIKSRIEYSIISRGTEQSGSKGYMAITEVKNGKRYFVISPHYSLYPTTYQDAFMIDANYSIEAITLSRFELIPCLALRDKIAFIKEEILLCGCGSVGFATLVYLLDQGFRNIHVLQHNFSKEQKEIYARLNRIYQAKIILVDKIGTYNTYIEATGESSIIEQIFHMMNSCSTIFLLGTPRQNQYLINPLDISRKNVCIFGGHELNGHTWSERDCCFHMLLENNQHKDLRGIVHICKATPTRVEEVLERKYHFFEVMKYDL